MIFSRIFKINLIFFLISSMVLPSYASLSATDGSSFVTKAEFDSALADFNSRLTTFEAGINSKIDSQVTSYLDRNGIWKGKPQDLDVADELNEVCCSADALASGKYTTIAGNKKWGSFGWVPKTNKIGLFVGGWTWRNATRNNSNSTRWGWIGKRNTSQIAPSDSGLSLIFEIYEKPKGSTTEVLKYTDVFLMNHGTLGCDGTTADNNIELELFVPLSAYDIFTPVQFFVGKESEVRWAMRCIYHFANLKGTENLTAYNSKTADTALYVEVNSAKIY